MVGLEKGNVKDGMETGKVRRETELVDKVGELALDGEGSETDVVEFVGGTGGLDMAAEEPDELVGLVGRSFRHIITKKGKPLECLEQTVQTPQTPE